jgi:hypothetical protein
MTKRQVTSLGITNIGMTTPMALVLYPAGADLSGGFWAGFLGFGYLTGGCAISYACFMGDTADEPSK